MSEMITRGAVACVGQLEELSLQPVAKARAMAMNRKRIWPARFLPKVTCISFEIWLKVVFETLGSVSSR